MSEPRSLRVRHLGLEAVEARAGGLNRYLDRLVAAQRARGISAEAVVVGPDEPLAPPAGTSFASRISAPLIVRMRAMTRAAVRPPLPDLLDVHFALYASIALRSRLRRLPLVVHFQGPWADESAVEGHSSRNITTKRMIEASVYRRADAVVVLSRAFAELVVDRYGVSPFAVRVLSPGVDVDRFTPGDRSLARARLGIHEDAALVIAVRRLRPRMGLEVAVESLDGIEIGRPVVMAIIGEGPERGALEALAARRGLDVRFPGRVSDEELGDWYRAADLSVVPSVALEGFGLIVLESLAAGTPVIASDLDGLRDALGAFEPDALVPPGDPSALRERIQGALDASRPLATPEACRRHAETLSWDTVAARHESLYRQVLAHQTDGGRPRVVVIGHTAALSGGELAMARTLPALHEHCDLHVILGADGPLVERLDAEGISVEVLAMPTSSAALRRDRVRLGGVPGRAAIGTVAYSARLARRLRQLRPDVVHTNTLKAALYGGVAARLARVDTVIWHLRDRIADDYLPSSAVRLVRAAAPRLADGVIANSAPTLATLGSLEMPSAVIPSPVEPSVRPRTERAPGPLRIGVIGRLAPWKGQLLFLEAFEEAFPEGDAHAVIVGGALFGEEDYEDALRERATASPLADRIELRGFRADVSSELDRLDIVVHSSVVPEPFGQVVVEAMAAGLPIIAADAGGPAETITDGVDGIVYPMGDRAALAEAMQSLATDVKRRAQLGHAALATAERYRAEVVAGEIAAFYDEVRRATR